MPHRDATKDNIKNKPPNKINILGVNYDNVTMASALERALGFLSESAPRTIVTANPEIVMAARKNPDILEVLNSGDMVTPDGIGVVLASKLWKHSFKERVTGYDLVLSIFSVIKDTGATVYFYGGAPGVAELAKIKMEKSYPGLKILGTCNGYVSGADMEDMLDDIKRLKPDLLLVGTGSPRQELWINKHKNDLPCKLFIGIGGSLDGYSGVVKRAPAWVSRGNIEWLYRLIKQPTRIKRQIKLPLFLLAAIKERLIGNNNKENR